MTDGNQASSDVSPVISPTISPIENNPATMTTATTTTTTTAMTDCNIEEISCPLITTTPLTVEIGSDTIVSSMLNTESSSEIQSSTTSPSPIPTSINSSNDQTSFNNKTVIIITPIIIVFIIVSLIIGILIYKRTHKKQNQGTILQFEPMHPHIVVVDADGNSLGKRSSIISSSNNSFIGNSKSPSRMIKVLAYDSEETESIVGNSSSSSKRKTMYYEDYR